MGVGEAGGRRGQSCVRLRAGQLAVLYECGDIIAQLAPPSAEPANEAFLQLKASGWIVRCIRPVKLAITHK
jgi:hypothetical protein